MKLTSLALFGAGYVLGTKAGRERYEQILELTTKAARNNLGQKSARDRIIEYANGGEPLVPAFGGSGGFFARTASSDLNGSSSASTEQRTGH